MPDSSGVNVPSNTGNQNHEEIEYQRATAAATSAANAQTAVEGASVLGLVGGSAITSGTWAVKLGEMATGVGRIAASGPGAPIAAVVMGMMPVRLNDGEQDFIDRMRLEQMREAPSRVRYTWEQDDKDNPVPHGWHTPPGKDMVRVRKMEWDSSRKAYTFTTEEDPRITIIWTPDSSGVNAPSNTGNQNPLRIPNPVVVDPLPEDTSIEATTSPAPEEKTFADYILILPISDIPPIYVYLNSILKGKDAEEAAKKLGYDRRVAPNKAPFNSHGQPAFFNGKDYITPDVDGHNVSEGWKKFSKKGVRLGTYDKDLNRVITCLVFLQKINLLSLILMKQYCPLQLP
ncbi:S-type pyocin domain-containing protein [Cedecea colo]|uniref:S-type pyocin domain-containing protein n=1 Tax=Cedecea colo TaxID=2552946 RepID=UPI0019113A42|nr:S-type pyocin domain-containing protein [Cedecea colo]